MPIPVKRVAGASATEQELEDPRVAREAEGLLQLHQVREDLDGALARFARGYAKYVEQRWEWEEPDWDADPETWPPLAKLTWLYDRALSLGNQANWLRHFPWSPAWCPDCHPGESRPEGYQRIVCADHLIRGGIGTIAHDWGVRREHRDD